MLCDQEKQDSKEVVSVITLHPSMGPVGQNPGLHSSLSSGQLCSSGPHVTALCSGGTLTGRGVARVMFELSQPSHRGLSVGLSPLHESSLHMTPSEQGQLLPPSAWLASTEELAAGTMDTKCGKNT